MEGGFYMNFFDDFSELVSTKGKDIANKAKNITDIASLRGQIATNNNSIAKKYREIGRQYYLIHKNDTVSEFHELITDIKALEKCNSGLQEKINEISGTIHCPQCQADVPKNSNFCLKCGAKIEDTFYDEEDSDPNQIAIPTLIDEDDD